MSDALKKAIYNRLLKLPASYIDRDEKLKNAAIYAGYPWKDKLKGAKR